MADLVTGVQTVALPIWHQAGRRPAAGPVVVAGQAPARAGRCARPAAGLRKPRPRRAPGGNPNAITGGDRVTHDMIYYGQLMRLPGHGSFRASTGLPGFQVPVGPSPTEKNGSRLVG